MPAPRTYSPNFDTVTKAADAAVYSTDGIVCRFLTTDLGSMEACRFAARSFQKSFTALRARANRLASTNTRDTLKSGPYAGLVCQLQPLADERGWTVSLIPSRIVLANLDIIDLATGKPLTGFGKEQDERTRLIEKSVHRPAEFTAEEYDTLTALDAEWRADNAREQEPWHTVEGDVWFSRPGTRNVAPSPLAQHKPVTDIVDLAALPSVFGVDGGKEGG